MVLFLFVILLVNVEVAERERRTTRQWRTGVALGVVLALELTFLVVRGGQIFEATAAREVIQGRTQNTELVGQALFTGYLLPFEIASVLLLVAMVGAVVLAKKDLR
jgi:NADH-quinone oxidoreductase subunit J